MNKELAIKCKEVLNGIEGTDDLINELTEVITKNEKSFEEYFLEWEKAIDEIYNKSQELFDLKASYSQLEQKIIEETDFKELYGRNNETVRKNHVKNELKDLVDRKHDLELRIDYLKRRCEFIRSIMSIQRALMDCGVGVE